MLSEDLATLSREAALYLYPLVIMDVTRLQAINTPAHAKPGHGPANQFHHLRAFPDADFRSVVRPDFDTLYSSAWLDLTAGPVVVHAPDTRDRYFMLPMLDMWTDVFANPGKRTTGTDAQDFVVTGPQLCRRATRGPSGHHRTHAACLDYRAHPDQRPRRLPGSPSGPGRLPHHPAGPDAPARHRSGL